MWKEKQKLEIQNKYLKSVVIGVYSCCSNNLFVLNNDSKSSKAEPRSA